MLRPLAFLLLAAVLLSGCRSLTVEDEARQIEERNCDGEAYHMNLLCTEEIELLNSAVDHPAVRSDEGVDRDHLNALSKERGLEFATAVFFHRVNREAETRRYLDRIQTIARGIERNGGKLPQFNREDVWLAMVPAMYYDSNASVGGDGRDIRNMASRLGIPNELVVVNPDGSVDQNGEFLCAWLDSRKNNGRKYIFASISKAALDIKRAIQMCGADGSFDNVRGWLNVGGVNRGSLLVNEMDGYWVYRWRARYFFWREDYTYESFLSVRVDPELPHYAHVRLPPRMKTVNVIATPTAQHLTLRAEEAYKILSKQGPNDGLTLLADAYMPGAINVSLWGNDHYFAVPEQREVLLAGGMIEMMQSIR